MDGYLKLSVDTYQYFCVWLYKKLFKFMFSWSFLVLFIVLLQGGDACLKLMSKENKEGMQLWKNVVYLKLIVK